MGFEPTRAEHNGLAVHRLNHSATASYFVDLISNTNFIMKTVFVVWISNLSCIYISFINKLHDNFLSFH
jgi:hypothetical protein